MSAPKRIQRKRTKGWRMPEGAVYVGRPSRWGNPFVVSRTPNGSWDVTADGRLWMHTTGLWVAQAKAVELFQIHAGPMGNYEIERDDLDELAGRDLACWCPLDQPCHADVLLEIANGGTR